MYSSRPLDAERPQLKNRTLIVSENQSLIDKISTLFSNKDWLTESMPVQLMIGKGASSALDYQCVVFVIDNNFRRHFNGLVTEMSAIIRNASAHTPVYLLFENDYDIAFSVWLDHVKKTFKSAIDHDNLHEAVENIVCTES